MDVHNALKEIFIDTLGLDILGMESEFPTLVKLIQTKTLTTFSQYIPAIYKIYLDLTDSSNVIANNHNSLGTEYFLEDPVLEKFHLPILGVEKIEYNNTGTVDPYDPNSSQYYSSIIASRNNIDLETVLMGSEYTYNRTLTDFSFPWKRYHEFRGGSGSTGVLYLKNYAFEGVAEVFIKTKWPNIGSIPEEYREIFIKLAILDIQIYLWNGLRYIEDIVTPSGNLQLRFDWGNAYQEREDYLRDLRNRTLPDRVFASYFHIV